MRHVPLSDFQTNISEFVAAAGAGEDVVVTRDGLEFLRLTKTEGGKARADTRSEERKAQQRAAVDAAYAFGKEILRRNGPTTTEERLRWIKEDQR